MKGSAAQPSPGWMDLAAAADRDASVPAEDLGTLYAIHAPSVARWAARLGGPEIDVEDAVHDVFVIVERKLSSFRRASSMSTWLYGITANVVRHTRRKNRMRRWLFGGEDDALVRRLASKDRTPIEALEAAEKIALVYAALDRLKEKYRSVLILHAVEGLTGPEIAALTHVAPSTVWVRLHRARALFLQILEEMR